MRSMSEIASSAPHAQFVTFVTTASYAEGAVALALSLRAFNVPDPVLEVHASESAAVALSSASSTLPPSAIRVVRLVEKLDTRPSPGTSTHNGKGARLEYDAPRRSLLAGTRPYVYLDADVLCVAPPLPALEQEFARLALANERAVSAGQPGFAFAACPPFRLKRKAYGEGNEAGFNAGVMLGMGAATARGDGSSHISTCTRTCGCTAAELAALQSDVDQHSGIALAATSSGGGDGGCSSSRCAGARRSAGGAAADTVTEERIMSDVFRGRWMPLPPTFNLVKRVWTHAPLLWQQLAPGSVFVHYIGGKPWMGQEAYRGADWEQAEAYSILEGFWRRVREGQWGGGEGADLQAAFRQLKPV